jgi:hypothetical protein
MWAETNDGTPIAPGSATLELTAQSSVSLLSRR